MARAQIILAGLLAGAALIIDPITGALFLGAAVAIVFVWQRRARSAKATATPN